MVFYYYYYYYYYFVYFCCLVDFDFDFDFHFHFDFGLFFFVFFVFFVFFIFNNLFFSEVSSMIAYTLSSTEYNRKVRLHFAAFIFKHGGSCPPTPPTTPHSSTPQPLPPLSSSFLNDLKSTVELSGVDLDAEIDEGDAGREGEGVLEGEGKREKKER